MSEAPRSNSSPQASPGAEPAPLRRSIRKIWEYWTHQVFELRESQFFLLLAILIGIFSGLAVVCFRVAIEWTRLTLLGSSLAPPISRVLIVPALGGIAVVLLVICLFPSARGSGVIQTKSAVYVSNGYIPFNAAIGKFFTCALAIGSGQSLGPEDPSLQIGAGIASAIGRRLNLSQEKIRMIAPVGAAAGLAAAFNAPISSVLFVIEEVIGTWSAAALGAIVLAAVASVVTMRSFLGADSLFRVPPFRVAHPSELLAYLVLGVAGGVVSLFFLKWIAYARPKIRELSNRTQHLCPAVAGLLIGFIAIWAPQVLGAGYPIIDQALHAEFTWKFLLLLAILKVLATGFSFLSATPGGLFAPTLFVGAMLGGAVGSIEHLFIPQLTGTIGTFALVGMGTLFAGFLRTPITSVFMVMEVSGSYTAILPVMISSLVAYVISRQYQRTPLFDLLAQQDGLALPSIEELREHVSLTVEDAMQSDGAVVVRSTDPFADVARLVESKTGLPIFILAGKREWRLLDTDSLQRLATAVPRKENLSEASSKGPMPVLFRDQSLADALHALGDWPALPVVSRADPARLEGVITVADVLRAFRNESPE